MTVSSAVAEKLYDQSGLLESQHHSLAFAALLSDYQIEQQVTARCADLDIEAKFLPPELVEQHSFPGRFVLSDFTANLSIADGQSEDAVWLMDATCNINGQPYNILTTPDQTTFRTEGYSGNALQYQFLPSMGQRFLASLALSGLHLDRNFVAPAYWPDGQSDSLALMLRLLGESHGNFSDQVTAFLPSLKSGESSEDSETFSSSPSINEDMRGLLITYTEQETPNTSGVSVKYRMAWYLGESMLNEFLSHQGEALIQGEAHSLRFNGQRPGCYLPDDLVLGNGFEEDIDDESLTFYPNLEPLEYARVNTTIIQPLHRYLQLPRYAWLENNRPE